MDEPYIEITEWTERYEVNASGRPALANDKLRTGPLDYIRLKVHGYSQGLGYRKLVAIAGGRAMAVFGLFCKLLEMAADSERNGRGTVRLSPKELSFALSVPEKQIKYGIAVLSELGWIHGISLNSAKIAENREPSELNTTQLNTTQHKKIEEIHAFPDYSRVKIFEAEWVKLVDKFGADKALGWVEKLDDYMVSSGKKYASHYRTILMWDKKDAKANPPKETTLEQLQRIKNERN